MAKNRSYSELRRLETFDERYQYLKLGGIVGDATFGFDRWINQEFYRSREWKNVRDEVIVRDNGCDLGVPGYEIFSGLVVHHMNPLTKEEIVHGNYSILNPNFLVCTSIQTHNAIHYGDEHLLPRAPVERKTGDTTLW